jgi:hypothetical protein
MIYGENLAACISAIKGQLFGHASYLFSSDRYIAFKQDPRLIKNCLLS